MRVEPGQAHASRDRADDWPPVSVIVPTRDRPQLLCRAVGSILAQDYPGPLECLVVFDRSVPAAPGVAIPEGKELRLLTNGRAPGLAGARNTGILAARGEFVAFCDDDDEWLPDKLRLQVAALRGQGGADVATCGVLVRYGDRTIARLPDRERLTLTDLLRSRHMEAHPSTVLARRRAVLEGIGLVDEDLPGSYAEDYEWLLRAARKAGIVAVRRPLVRVYWHRASYFAGRWATIVSALTDLLAKHPEFERESRGLARIYGQIAFAHAAQGHRAEAGRWALRCLRRYPLELRGYLAVLVGLRLLSPDAVLGAAHRLGRGI